jgi:hypothetical protein
LSNRPGLWKTVPSFRECEVKSAASGSGTP